MDECRLNPPRVRIKRNDRYFISRASGEASEKRYVTVACSDWDISNADSPFGEEQKKKTKLFENCFQQAKWITWKHESGETKGQTSVSGPLSNCGVHGAAFWLFTTSGATLRVRSLILSSTQERDNALSALAVSHGGRLHRCLKSLALVRDTLRWWWFFREQRQNLRLKQWRLSFTLPSPAQVHCGHGGVKPSQSDSSEHACCSSTHCVITTWCRVGFMWEADGPDFSAPVQLSWTLVSC